MSLPENPPEKPTKCVSVTRLFSLVLSPGVNKEALNFGLHRNPLSVAFPPPSKSTFQSVKVPLFFLSGPKTTPSIDLFSPTGQEWGDENYCPLSIESKRRLPAPSRQAVVKSSGQKGGGKRRGVENKKWKDFPSLSETDRQATTPFFLIRGSCLD